MFKLFSSVDKWIETGASMHLYKPASLGSWTNLLSQLPSTTIAICQTRYPVYPFVTEGNKQDHSFYGQILLDATQSDCSVSRSLNEFQSA